MRPDVKLGVVISLVVVLVAGGYYLYRDSREVPIPVTDDTMAAAGNADEPRSPTKADTPRGESRPRPKAAANRPRDKGNRTKREGPPKTEVASKPRTERRGTVAKEDSSRIESRQAKREPTTEPASERGPSQSRRPEDTRQAKNTPRAPKGTDLDSSPGSRRKAETPGGREQVAQATPARSDHPSRSRGASGRVGRRGRPEVNAPRSETQGARQGSTTLASGATPRQARGRRLEGRPAREAVETHRVQLGDTLASLARDYYGHEKYTQFLVGSNPQIPNPNRLRIGMSVKIPPRPTNDDRGVMVSPGEGTASSRGGSAGPRTYTVQSGDSFYGIARSVLGDASRWEELFAMNKDLVQDNPKRLQIGHVLTLPD